MDCGRRFVTEEHRAACDTCGGYLKNLAVPRE
ncbi:rubrerythrin-like domain-containing protein [Halobacteriaceae archaeon GCM10025711]